jgi:hypothetical protein
MDYAVIAREMNKSFCFFFQKEALSCFILMQPSRFYEASGSFLKKRTKKLSLIILS